MSNNKMNYKTDYTEKEKLDFDCLVKLGDSPELAHETIMAERQKYSGLEDERGSIYYNAYCL